MDDERKIKVDRIDPNLPAKEEIPSVPAETSKENAWKIFLIFVLKKILHILSDKQVNFQEEPFYADLVQLKKALEKLTQSDLSQDSSFLTYLSLIWLNLNSHLVKATSLNKEKINPFIKEFYRYPANTEFSLGYYLSELAGHKWIPFPYMEILHKLHEDFQHDKKNSQLALWLAFLEKF